MEAALLRDTNYVPLEERFRFGEPSDIVAQLSKLMAENP